MQIHQQRAERANLQRLLLSFQDAEPDVAERAVIQGLWRTARYDPAHTILCAGEGVRLITSGWVGWMRYSDNGQRLIFLFLMPGDFIIPALFEPGCCELASLTPLRTVDASALQTDATPMCAAKIARSGREYRRLLIEHLTRLTIGCTTKSVANLLHEFHVRSLRAGWSVDGRFTLPIGQRVIARALGRSSVQVHKIINKFQADGVIKVGFDWVDVLDPEALRQAAGITHSKRIQSEASDGLDEPIVVTKIPALA